MFEWRGSILLPKAVCKLLREGLSCTGLQMEDNSYLPDDLATAFLNVPRVGPELKGRAGHWLKADEGGKGKRGVCYDRSSA